MVPGRSEKSPCKRVLDELQTLYLEEFEVEKKGVAVVEF